MRKAKTTCGTSSKVVNRRRSSGLTSFFAPNAATGRASICSTFCLSQLLQEEEKRAEEERQAQEKAKAEENARVEAERLNKEAEDAERARREEEEARVQAQRYKEMEEMQVCKIWKLNRAARLDFSQSLHLREL